MHVDWVTVAAQMVNFLVLVYLLQRFLYEPIVRNMDRREQRIADRLRDAEQQRAAAEAEAERYRQERRDLDERRAALLEDARREADALRERLRDEARASATELSERWRRDVAQERDRFLRDFRRRIVDQFCVFARKALGELADEDLQERLAGMFLRRLHELRPEERRELFGVRERGAAPVRIASAFPLSPETKRHLTRAVHDTLDESLDVEFVAGAPAACGIEMTVGDRVVSWSLETYVDEVEDHLRQGLAGAGETPDTPAEEAPRG